jgi:hypothetical protein
MKFMGQEESMGCLWDTYSKHAKQGFDLQLYFSDFYPNTQKVVKMSLKPKDSKPKVCLAYSGGFALKFEFIV